VIPHGHFGNLMNGVRSVDRAAVEAQLGLRHGALRLGIIGAPRLDKRVDLVMEAVAASARDDIELLVLSLGPAERAPDDKRIIAYPYEMAPRDEYNRRLAAIDVLVLPFADGEMLATGTVGDAIGLGLPSLVSGWPFLAESLGDAGICYGWSAEDLTRCIDGLDDEQLARARRAAERLQPVLDWAAIAQLHIEVLERVGTAKL
jgi:glycosyltransferase involved in cell wall biosynthesis